MSNDIRVNKLIISGQTLTAQSNSLYLNGTQIGGSSNTTIAYGLLTTGFATTSTGIVSGLSFNIGANENWIADFYAAVNVGAAAGAKFGIKAPDEANVGGMLRGTNAAAVHISATGLSAAAVVTSQNAGVDLHVYIQNGPNTGVVALWAGSADGNGANPLTFFSGRAHFLATKV